MPTVIRSSQAEVDLVDIWAYIAYFNVDAADHLVDRIDQTCRVLAANPEMGERRDDLAAEMRIFSVRKHVICYRPLPDGILILRVLSGYRDFTRLFP